LAKPSDPELFDATECPKRCSKDFLDCNCQKIGNMVMIYNNKTKVVLILLLSTITALAFALIQEGMFSYLDTLYPIDLWSIAHFFFGFGLFSVIYLVLRNRNLSLLICLGIYPLHEWSEWALKPYYPQITEEIWTNILADLIIDVFGTLVAYFLIVSLLTSKNRSIDH